MKPQLSAAAVALALTAAICASCSRDEAAAIPNAKPLDPAVAKKYAGWRFIPKAPGAGTGRTVQSAKEAPRESGG